MQQLTSYSKKSMNQGLILKYILPALCIVLLCHSGSLNLMEKYLGSIYQEKIENHYIGDTRPLFNGSIRFQDAVSQNIQKFLKNDRGIKFFNLKLNILITSENGKIVYPAYDSPTPGGKDGSGLWNNTAIARKNFNLLHEKRNIFVVTSISYFSLASGLILIFYLILAFIIFELVKKTREKNIRKYHSRGKIILKLQAEEKELKAEEQKLKKENAINKQRLKDLETQRQYLVKSLNSVRAEQSEELIRARINEDEMICEIDRLEKKLSKDIALQKAKEQEIEKLKRKVIKYERRKGRGGKRGAFDLIARRFATLYKNVDMNRRALTGFSELNDNQKIKAEEIVHQLNHDMDKVIIKRKVFSGKKDKNTFFEALFAYNGRLYFRKTEANRVEVLIIGTKNTQNRDMEFLHQL